MIVGKLITLLTDFGDRDVYVGVMKGAIASINRQLQVVDLTHQIPPQNILAARFALLNAYPYFPPQTVHIAVVDPGVGSNRKSIAIQFSEGYIVCPDNGLSSGIIDFTQAIAAVELTNPQYWRVSEPSTTFHGRDIFAPVGAHLASGVPLQALGQEIDLGSLVRLDLPSVEINQHHITGSIQYIDYFGNLITNISGDLVQAKTWCVMLDQIVINSGKTYSDVAFGEAVTLVGSHGWIEIAVNAGNAQKQLQISWGDLIKILVD
ncbi:MAG: SAM hydrolase/SAM-dependent halogenase family protein [Waterburya sp.]